MKSTTGAADDDRFTVAAMRSGISRTLPVAAAGCVDGLLLGVLCAHTGLSIAESVLMSAMVFAGTAQLVALDMWVQPVPVAALIFTTALVNARHVLMGVSLALRDTYVSLSRPQTYASLFFLTDESWAVTMAEQRDGQRNAAFLIGSGVTLYVSWVASTAVGRITGMLLEDPERFGLDFAFTAIFVALVVNFRQGRRDLGPWSTAAAVAIAGSYFLPANTHILAGSLAGIAVAAMQE